MKKQESPGAGGKAHLPEKICLACGRPFAWRKKWRASWDEVKTCSERCKGELRRETRAQKNASA
ncbi:MAG: DUF2256 domain-containing protein [Methylocystis sp.]|nr:MAG: DUF2256 domain-containing protein [Methylocystis sp.]